MVMKLLKALWCVDG